MKLYIQLCFTVFCCHAAVIQAQSTDGNITDSQRFQFPTYFGTSLDQEMIGNITSSSSSTDKPSENCTDEATLLTAKLVVRKMVDLESRLYDGAIKALQALLSSVNETTHWQTGVRLETAQRYCNLAYEGIKESGLERPLLLPQLKLLKHIQMDILKKQLLSQQSISLKDPTTVSNSMYDALIANLTSGSTPLADKIIATGFGNLSASPCWNQDNSAIERESDNKVILEEQRLLEWLGVLPSRPVAEFAPLTILSDAMFECELAYYLITTSSRSRRLVDELGRLRELHIGMINSAIQLSEHPMAKTNFAFWAGQRTLWRSNYDSETSRLTV